MKKEPSPLVPGVWDISSQELSQWLKNNDESSYRLIDVRTPEEYVGDLGHINGAELIELQALESALAQFNKNEMIIFVCRSGMRSTQACSISLSLGFKNVLNLSGGMIDWNRTHRKES